MADQRVASLRELFRNIQQWRSLNESEGFEILRCPITKIEWSIWDIEYLLDEGLAQLPRGQREAIRLCLVEDMKESEAAVKMGVSPTNPVAMYATDGIKALLRKIDSGELRFLRAAA